jgi:hypothetical protein
MCDLDQPLRSSGRWLPQGTTIAAVASMRKRSERRSQAALVPSRIGRTIRIVRGHNVMIDADLADLYQVDVKVLNQAVKRNRARFPADFMFQLTAREAHSLRSQSVT